MAERFTTTITQRGQVTLPSAVRRALGVKAREKVTFEIDGDMVRVLPPSFTVASAGASVPPLSPHHSLDEIYEIARDDHADHVLREGQP